MTVRRVRLYEPVSGLETVATLLDAEAPRNASALWTVAGLGRAHDTLHAMWSGPEISFQVSASRLAPQLDIAGLPPENATTHPAAGDIALACVAAGDWPGQPGRFLDLGLFYAANARLFLPHGWVSASACARIAVHDLPAVASTCRTIRLTGLCGLHVVRLP